MFANKHEVAHIIRKLLALGQRSNALIHCTMVSSNVTNKLADQTQLTLKRLNGSYNTLLKDRILP